jgi:hypothetical protein
MALDELILQTIRESSRDLWRGVRHRIGRRALLLLVLAFGCLWAIPRLLGDAWQAGRALPTAAAIGWLVLLTAALLAAWALALLDSLHALLVTGPLLGSLGDMALSPQVRPAGPDLAAQFSAFASPRQLARAARVRDLPLILFLVRIILRVDVKALLQTAEAGLGRAALVREVERQARQRAAAVLHRLKIMLWVAFGCVVPLPFLVGWALG